MEMSVEIPYFAAICARQRILRTRTQFCEIIKDPEISSWPFSKTLFLLRLWSMMFPCSDFRHVVMTPAILLMCEYLMRCPIVCKDTYFTPRSMWVKNLYQNVGAYTGFFKYIRFHNILRISTSQRDVKGRIESGMCCRDSILNRVLCCKWGLNPAVICKKSC
ncbi:hypothetical protein ACB092_01G127300 [Castanea dentata]